MKRVCRYVINFQFKCFLYIIKHSDFNKLISMYLYYLIPFLYFFVCKKCNNLKNLLHNLKLFKVHNKIIHHNDADVTIISLNVNRPEFSYFHDINTNTLYYYTSRSNYTHQV